MAGQEHIVRAFKNIVAHHKISQSYLFSGPRGVGKTTLARILAKSLNCVKGPTIRPCEVCEYCLGVSQDSSLDYREIDGASNRGIDQMREINESLRYVSHQNKYRIIVIDEAHMLTKEAFNALLKNLEEPPPNVVFIFCTTEIQKIPLTIRSRCQHYAFRAFSVASIVAQLKTILDSEKIAYEEQALPLIAKNARGSMRDSQSILDQIIAYSDEKITLEDVQTALGLNDEHLYIDFLNTLFKEDVKAGFSIIQSYISEGNSSGEFAYGLVEYFNRLVFVKNGVDKASDLDLDDATFNALQSLSSYPNLDELFTLSDIAFDLLEHLKTTVDEKTTFEYFLLKMFRYKKIISPGVLKDQLLKIQKEESKDAPLKSSVDQKQKISEDKKPSVSQSSLSAFSEPKKEIQNFEAFLKKLSQSLKVFIVGFDKPFLTLAGDVSEAVQMKIVHKIKQDYDFDVKLNVLSSDKKDMKHLHQAFMQFGEIKKGGKNESTTNDEAGSRDSEEDGEAPW